MIVFCLCGQSSSECWSKQSPVWDISVIGRELNSIGKGGCGRIEGTLSKCGANHVFALDDAEHLPTQVLIQVVPSCILPRGWGFSYVLPAPKPPNWQLRLSRQYAFVSLRRVVANRQQCRTNGTGQVPIAFEKAHK
jgi:hypothetical protein